MKMLYVGFLVLLLLPNTSLASDLKQSDSSVEYKKSVSYSITASSIRSSVLHIDNGMAIALTATKDTCVLVTAKHLVQNASSVMAMPLSDGLSGQEKIKADVIYIDNTEDVAFLSIATHIKCATPPVVSNENILIGKYVTAFKHLPDGSYHTAGGHVIDFWELPNGKKFMVANMSVEDGFSGGGAFDSDGNLIGLISGRNDGGKVRLTYLVSGPRILSALIKSKNN